MLYRGTWVNILRKGVGEYIPLVLLILLVSMFIVFVERSYLQLHEYAGKMIEEIEHRKEKVGVVFDRQMCAVNIVNMWSGSSRIAAILLLEDNDVKILNYSRVLAVGKSDKVLLKNVVPDVDCGKVDDVCVVTNFMNVFCSSSSDVEEYNYNNAEASSNEDDDTNTVLEDDPRALALLAQLLPPNLYRSITSRYYVVGYTLIKPPEEIQAYVEHVSSYYPLGKRYTRIVLNIHWPNGANEAIGLGTKYCNLSDTKCSLSVVKTVTEYENIAKLVCRINVDVSISRNYVDEVLYENISLRVRTSFELLPVDPQYKLLLIYDRATDYTDSGLYNPTPLVETDADVRYCKPFCAGLDTVVSQNSWHVPKDLWSNSFVSLCGKRGYYTIGILGFYNDAEILGTFWSRLPEISWFYLGAKVGWFKIFIDNSQVEPRYHAIIAFLLIEKG